MLKFFILSMALSTTQVYAEEQKVLDCLATAIITESIGEPYKGQFAVAKVILNRSAEMNVDVCKVIYQKGQFTNIKSGKVAHLKKNNTVDWLLAKSIAKNAVAMKDVDPTNGATYFIRANGKTPKEYKKKIQLAVIGNHKFFKDDPAKVDKPV
jgi:N-acetylmuramoyl-L-alanine amidase